MSARRFFESVYRDNQYRHEDARRALKTDLPLYLKNRALEPLDALLRRRYARRDVPIVFIVGPPRSGTTLLYQLVADHLDVGFINNRMARYFAAPVVGAALHGRTGGGHSLALSSDHGRTPGDEAPHEFSWFWHYYGDFGQHDDLSREEWARVDWIPVKRSLEALAGYFARPLVLKNINAVAYQIAELKRLLPSAKFISIRRDPRYIIQSILRVRADEYGDRGTWWSVRPRDVDQWQGRSPVAQVAHQVSDVSHAVREGLATLPESDRLEVDYEALVREPARVLDDVARLTGARIVDRERLDALTLIPRNRKTIDDDTWAQIEIAVER
ncbi:MAG: sulfotransferase [Polyangiales bacterium]